MYFYIYASKYEFMFVVFLFVCCICTLVSIWYDLSIWTRLFYLRWWFYIFLLLYHLSALDKDIFICTCIIFYRYQLNMFVSAWWYDICICTRCCLYVRIYLLLLYRYNIIMFVSVVLGLCLYENFMYYLFLSVRLYLHYYMIFIFVLRDYLYLDSYEIILFVSVRNDS